jgi:DNA-directed RNA polymerase subunit RPC12/RpoP
MPWRCPACSSFIRRELAAAGDELPRPGRIYRCSICRLELVLSDDGTRMEIAPIPTEGSTQK